LVEISSTSEKLSLLCKKRESEGIDHAKWSLLAQKRKFFLSPRKRNDAPTVSNTPPTDNSPMGARDSMRNAITPVLEKIALREM
jgi:hypothetical protein